MSGRRMRLLAAAAAVVALAAPAAAETLAFNAQLGPDIRDPAHPTKATGHATLSLDTASRTLSWSVTYSGLAGPAQRLGCGALDAPGGPAVSAAAPLASPIRGAKALTEAQITALKAGHWVCLIETGNDQTDIGGAVHPAP